MTPYIGSTAQTPVTVTGSPPATSATVTGLTNGTSYTFTVSATNANGTRPASSPSNAVTPNTPAGGADRGDGDRGQRVGDGELDGTSQQWRQRDHQLHGDAVHRLDRADAGDGDRQPAGHLDHGDRADQRHQLHLHRVGDQRQRHRAGLLAVQRRDPERANGAGGADGGDGDRGQRLGGGELDGAGQQWRQRDHQLHGDAVHRLDRADAGDGDRQPAGHLDHGDRADQRHQLHLHRVGDQRCRHRAGLVAVQRRDPERAADGDERHAERGGDGRRGLGRADGDVLPGGGAEHGVVHA